LGKKIRVLIIDDSAYSRQAIKGMLEKAEDIEVIGVASDGIDGIAKTLRYKPDIITLDIEMPQMDGFSFLRWLMKEQPTPAIMISSRSDNKTIFRTLEMGAVDFVVKPTRRASPEIGRIEQDLLDKIHNITKRSLRKLTRNLNHLYKGRPKRPVGKKITSKYRILGIGASTGGPQALQYILTSLSEGFPLPIVIAQHMPRGFTGPLALRLDRLCYIRVKEAVDGEILQPGVAYISPGGYHLMVKKKGGDAMIDLAEADESDRYVPSANRLMSSVSEVFKKQAIGVILTGMGNDGKEGMKELHRAGGFTIAESEETAVVFGMPNEVIKAGAVREILPLHGIPERIKKMIFR